VPAHVLWALLASSGPGVAALIGAVLALRPAGHIGRGMALRLVVMGMLDLAATALFAVASRHGLLRIVSVAGSLYPLARWCRQGSSSAARTTRAGGGDHGCAGGRGDDRGRVSSAHPVATLNRRTSLRNLLAS
jgi:hypothetical protein